MELGGQPPHPAGQNALAKQLMGACSELLRERLQGRVRSLCGSGLKCDAAPDLLEVSGTAKSTFCVTGIEHEVT